MKNKNTPISIDIDKEKLQSLIKDQQELSKMFLESCTPGNDDSFDIIKFLSKLKDLENEK